MVEGAGEGGSAVTCFAAFKHMASLGGGSTRQSEGGGTCCNDLSKQVVDAMVCDFYGPPSLARE